MATKSIDKKKTLEYAVALKMVSQMVRLIN